jgi:NAD(P)-dependent dehydrogenase (short-subunit alcohol dehydrogenase family)
MSETPEVASGGWLISGCSTGIGRHIAEAALEKGHRVAVTARRREAVEDLVAPHTDRAIALAQDVTKREQVDAAVREAERAFGGIDVLVNNAGYTATWRQSRRVRTTRSAPLRHSRFGPWR